MRKPLLATSTKSALQSIIDNPPHALLLTGLEGIGKRTVAAWLIEQLSPGPQLLVIEPEVGKQSIGIEAIRSLERFTALKVAGSNAVNRVVFIPDAEQLSHEAQNAMLKTLEEPPTGTLLVLTSAHAGNLLSTIRSRLQSIEIIAPDPTDLSKQLPKHPSLTTSQIMSMSGGLPGLAFVLAEGDDTHPTVQAVVTARSILQASTFERMALVDKLAKDRPLTMNMLDMLMRMARAALTAGADAKRWRIVLSSSYAAREALESNAQPKLTLTNLMLTL